MSRRAALRAAFGSVLLVALARAWPLFTCPAPCMVDFARLEGADQPLLHLSVGDGHLNAWIIAWVQHALATAPLSLFDANIFHPTPGILAGSEHLLGLALPLLPLRLFTDDAMLLHQTALALAFVGTGVTTFALAHWLTGSPWAGFLAGATAVLMPWRLAELSHLQLASTTWIPLVWLLIAHTFVEGPRLVRSAALGVVVGLQLLTSYYLAYALLVSSAVLMLALLLSQRSSRTAWCHVLGAFAVPMLVLMVVSLPYLRSIDSMLVLRGQTLLSLPLGLAWNHVAPPLTLLGSTALPIAARYETPLVVALLALASICGGKRWTSGFWLIAVAGFVLSIGRSLVIGGVAVPMPAQLAAALLPGFDELRAPLRWGILIGLAMPVLAALGAHRIDLRVAAQGSGVTMLYRVVVVLLLAAGLVAPLIPTAAAFREIAPDLAIYDSLRRQPEGAVLEVPWPIVAGRDASLAGEYMLASTRHWRPILNGYTGHPPRDYEDRRREAYALPEPAVLDELVRTTGLRWVIVHRALLTEQEREAWDFAPMSGRVAVVDQRGDARLYEVFPPGR